MTIIIKTSTKSEKEKKNRYPGTDPQAGWTVKSPSGVVRSTLWSKDKEKPFESDQYVLVQAAARLYTQKTGVFAQAVRL